MTAKEYLYQAFRLDQKIKSKLEQVVNLRDMAAKAMSSINAERVSGTTKRCPMENALIKLVDLEHEINDDIDQLMALKRELACVFGKIDNQACRLLLELRYLAGKNWAEVAKIMGYEVRWIYQMHGKALQ